MTSLAVADRRGSALSVALIVGGTVAGVCGGIAGAANRSVQKLSESVSNSVWSNYADSTHSAAMGLLASAHTLSSRDIAAAVYRAVEAGRVRHIVASPSIDWRHHVLNPQAPTDVDLLTETADLALDFVSNYGAARVELTDLDPSKVNGEHLATLLRALSTWRYEIPGWQQALQLDVEVLERSGVDPRDALFGMI
jgi:hypothetical protein